MMMKSLFELLEGDSAHPLNAALFMTYGFDAQLFEHHVLPAVYKIDVDYAENERRFRAQITENLLKHPVTVLVDGQGYEGGKTLLYDLYNVKGCTFHPKCYLLLYAEYLRIIIASANLTKTGMCYNAEIFWQYDLYEGDKTTVAADLLALISRLKDLEGLAGVLRGNAAYKTIEEFLNTFPAANQPGGDIIHSTLETQSFASKLVDLAKKKGSPIKSIRVLSPFFESDKKGSLESAMMGELFGSLKSLMTPKTTVEVCFPGWKDSETGRWSVRAPVNLLEELGEVVPGLSLQVVSDIWRDEEEEHTRTLHAKIVEIGFQDGSWLYLVGSPNFTRAAMNSRADRLNNLEIGVFARQDRRIDFPQMDNVKLGQLVIIPDVVGQTTEPVIFVEKAEYVDIDGQNPSLQLTVDVKKAVYPFEVVYQQRACYHANQSTAVIVITPFKLGHSMDITIRYEDKSFTVPIQVREKYRVAADELVGSDFEPTYRDILEYQAGRFRSLEEIIVHKTGHGKSNGDAEMELLIEGFRTNLNLLFKALGGIKMSLEQPAWSEDGFKYELNAPLGIVKLIDLIETEYLEHKLPGPEAFFYMIEFAALLKDLAFEEGDRLDNEAKQGLLSGLKEKSDELLRAIYAGASGELKRQYRILAEEYGVGGVGQ